MKFVSEQTIEAVIESLDQNIDHYNQAVVQLKEEQPAIYTFLFSDSFTLLSQNERELLLYLVLITWKSIKETVPSIQKLAVENIEEAEEKNYGLLEKVKSKSFRERLDLFFENSPQEDLLALAEDVLTADEEEKEISTAAQEPIFLAVKSIVDAFEKQA